jgi:hypothetical protein
MGPYRTIEQAKSEEERYDNHLSAACESFPEWEIVEALGGLVAVPRGTEVIRASTIDGLVMKLRQQP